MNRQPPEPVPSPVPRHLAVIMDGNGRWAQRRGLPRAEGHRAGVKAVRRIVQAAGNAGIPVLTLFAFSQENWKRPPLEVRLLMKLLLSTLTQDLQEFHEAGIRLRVIGLHDKFEPELRRSIVEAETLTAGNTAMTLVIALGYGGQWDIVQAAQRVVAHGCELSVEAIDRALSTAEWPHPDLLIRTGGEYRISNFMLWQLAYAELYFTDLLWPDADAGLLQEALAWFGGRERRFGGLLNAQL